MILVLSLPMRCVALRNSARHSHDKFKSLAADYLVRDFVVEGGREMRQVLSRAACW